MSVPAAQQLHRYLPQYDIGERHQIMINATPEAVYTAIHCCDMRASKIINCLFYLRGILQPAHFKDEAGNQSIAMIDFLTKGHGAMLLLEEVENQEVVLGFAGKFWRPSPQMLDLANAAEFMDFNELGYSKAAWNFYLEKNAAGTVTLLTETRVKCLGWRAKAMFRLYWTVIKPFSGWIRLELLKVIKGQAEGR